MLKISDVIRELEEHIQTMGDREVVVARGTELYDVRYVMTQPVGKEACTIALIPNMLPKGKP